MKKDQKKFAVKLDVSVKSALGFQNYDPQPVIDGVFHQPLKKHADLNGSFMEFFRCDKKGRVKDLPGDVDFQLRQVSVSHAAPGRINAFHVHPKVVQDEFWCVIGGAMRIWLADVRADSPTSGVKRPFVLTGDAPAILYIPAGVAHGYQAGSDGAVLLYAMNSQFDISDPNEGRLPWDYFGDDLWEDDRG